MVAAAPPLPWGALSPKLASCACVRALTPPPWRRRRSHFSPPPRELRCVCPVSLRKAAATDRPERAVFSDTRKQTPVGERRLCHPLEPWGSALLQPGFVARRGRRWRVGEGARRPPGSRIAGCVLLAAPRLSSPGRGVDPFFPPAMDSPYPKQLNPPFLLRPALGGGAVAAE